MFRSPMPRETSAQIDAAAADWAARVDRGLSPDEAQALEAWLTGDARRLGAYGRLRAVSAWTERAAALGPTYDPVQFAGAAAPSRRRLLQIGGGLAAGVATALVGGAVWVSQGERYKTARGEMRVVPLADGSVITLNTNSRIALAFTEDRRLVRLIEGEALFDVAKDAARPFFVEAGKVRVRAVGTSFVVRRLTDTPVQVLVREGVVEVDPGDASRRPVRLAQNSRAVASASSVDAAAVPASEIGRELAWRDGRIAFEGQSLAAASREFERYSDTQIVIDDPVVARETITGLFQANDPVGFAQAVATSFGWRAEVGAREVRIVRGA